MRKLMWFSVGFTGACAVGVYILSGFWSLLLAAFGLCAGIGLLVFKSNRLKITGVILFGLAVGLCWVRGYHAIYIDPLTALDGTTVNASVEICDYSHTTDAGTTADGRIYLAGKHYTVRLYVDRVDTFRPGDRLDGQIQLRLTTLDAERPTYHQGNGIFLLGYVQEACSVSRSQQIPGKYFAAKLRHDILSILDQLFPEDTVAFARALLLGDSSKLTYEEDTAFKVSGIRHIVAVSGLHVSILFSLVYFISGRKRQLVWLIGLPLLLLFAAVAGFTPSVVRACIMQGLIVLSLLVNKEYDPPTALATSALVILFINPMTITSVSFQLSVGCMVGIFLFSGRVHDRLLRGKRAEFAKGNSLRARIVRWTVNSVSVTLGAMVTTTPLCAWYFGMVSIVGVITNLLTLWVISFVFYGIMAACVAGAVWLPAGKLVALLISWPMRFVGWVAKSLSKMPLAAVYTCSGYIVAWLFLSYLLFVFFLCSKKKRPAYLLCCIGMGLFLAVGASRLEPMLDDYRVNVIDVGQGQCILLQSQGENYMVDCGGDYDDAAADTAAQLLLSQGITRLDGLFLTHYDRDHAGGAGKLLSRIPAKDIYLPDIPDDGKFRAELTRTYRSHIQWIREDRTLTTNSFAVTIFAPEPGSKGNESCLCLLFQRKNCDILITGDRNAAGEKALLSRTELPQLELLVVGHHGSAKATSFELLERTKPAAAAISVGKDNSHGHPAPQVLRKLALFGTAVWRTDLHGTILFRG